MRHHHRPPAGAPSRSAVTHGIASTLAASSIDPFLGNAIGVDDLLLSGVLPRHPDTRFVSVESSIGWFPFVLRPVRDRLHPTCLYGNVREQIDAAYGDLDADDARRILYADAAELYGVGRPERAWEPAS